jgi:hypothetical protein
MDSPANTILDITLSYYVPRCLYLLAELGVADVLGDEPRTAAELASGIGVDADALARALRLVSAYGVFEPRDAAYLHTPASRLLRTDHPQSMRAWVLWSSSEIVWKSCELLGYSIRTGKPAANLVPPGDTWTYLAQHAETSRIFDAAMTGKAHSQVAGILAHYDFSPFHLIADIGGGRGHLLQAVLSAVPDASGVLFDLPNVVGPLIGTGSSRLTLQAGDFLKDPLPECDAYLLMQVIHDWIDEDALRILGAIRRAAPVHAKLLLIEGIIPSEPGPSWIKMLDIGMLTLFGSKERTRREFEHLLGASGFQLRRVIDVGLGTSILEASAI